MKKAEVYMYEHLAGHLIEDEEGYHFTYLTDYLNNNLAEPISLTLPLQKDTFHSKILFPFFDGLIPEGWLLDVASKSWKINQRDRMSLLLACCKDCIGAVSIVEVKVIEENE
jgi:serine/threonine-protein kinase HipA